MRHIIAQFHVQPVKETVNDPQLQNNNSKMADRRHLGNTRAGVSQRVLD